MMIVIIFSDEYAFSSTKREELYTIMREAYARTEVEIWGENYTRIPQSNYETLIEEGKIGAAFIDDQLVGGISARRIDEETFSFGLLAVHEDFGSRGVGRALVEAVEHRAQQTGAKYMNIEILRPRDFTLAMKDRLHDWYKRMGYVFTHDENFQDRRPDRAKDLKVPSVFDCYRKELVG